MGLAAVRGIVRSDKGGLQVRSTPGRGTTFRVLLPVAEDEPSFRKIAVPVERDSGSRRTHTRGGQGRRKLSGPV